MEGKKEGTIGSVFQVTYLIICHVFIPCCITYTLKITHHAVAFNFQNEIDESHTAYVASRTAFPCVNWELELSVSHIALL